MSTLTQFFTSGGGGGGASMTGQAFTAPGTWTSPASATAATFYAVGGGGGGAGFSSALTFGTYGGGGGGGGSITVMDKVISPSTGYPVTIGSGGISVAVNGIYPGGTTRFNGVTGLGGQGGSSGSVVGYGGLGAGQYTAWLQSNTVMRWSNAAGSQGPGLSPNIGPVPLGAYSYGMGLTGAQGAPLVPGIGASSIGATTNSGGASWGDGGTGVNTGGGGEGFAQVNAPATISGTPGSPGYAQVIY